MPDHALRATHRKAALGGPEEQARALLADARAGRLKLLACGHCGGAGTVRYIGPYSSGREPCVMCGGSGHHPAEDTLRLLAHAAHPPARVIYPRSAISGLRWDKLAPLPWSWTATTYTRWGRDPADVAALAMAWAAWSLHRGEHCPRACEAIEDYLQAMQDHLFADGSLRARDNKAAELRAQEGHMPAWVPTPLPFYGSQAQAATDLVRPARPDAAAYMLGVAQGAVRAWVLGHEWRAP